MKKGFTLLELLIAFLISGFVIVSVFNILNSSGDVRGSSEKNVTKNETKILIQKIIYSDLFSMLNEPVQIKTNTFDKSFSFRSMHSLFFSSGIPVTITYQLEKNKLYRTEENSEISFSEKYLITDGVDNFKIFGFDGNEYKEDFIKSNIFKFVIFADEKIEISAGNIFYAR